MGRAAVALFTLLFAMLVQPGLAPRGMLPSISAFASPSSADTDGGRTHNAPTHWGTAATIGAAAAAGLVAVRLAQHSHTPGGSPAWQSGGSSQPKPPKPGFGLGAVSFGGLEDSEASDEDNEDYNAGGCSESSGGESDEGDSGESRARAKPAASKLWSSAEFPEGTLGGKNYDMANLRAAQNWTCPCKDRRNCIGQERLPDILRPPRVGYPTAATGRVDCV